MHFGLALAKSSLFRPTSSLPLTDVKTTRPPAPDTVWKSTQAAYAVLLSTVRK